MKRRGALVTIPMLLLLLCVAVIGTVSSSWKYAVQPVSSFNSSASISLASFVTNEIPPTPEGEKHQSAIDNIVDGNTGLNMNNSNINQKLEDHAFWGHDTYGSFNSKHGQEAATDMGLDPNVNFIIEMVSDTKRYVYTTTMEVGPSSSLMSSASPYVPIGEYIYVIYRSTVELNTTTNQWVTTETLAGYAKSALYKNPSWTGIYQVETPAFDPKSWQAGKLGTSTNDAVYTYVGVTTDAVLGNATDTIYYKLTAPSRQNITVNVTTAGATASVLNANGNAVKAVANTTNGSNKVTFKPKANATYYIALTGNVAIDFNIN